MEPQNPSSRRVLVRRALPRGPRTVALVSREAPRARRPGPFAALVLVGAAGVAFCAPSLQPAEHCDTVASSDSHGGNAAGPLAQKPLADEAQRATLSEATALPHQYETSFGSCGEAEGETTCADDAAPRDRGSPNPMRAERGAPPIRQPRAQATLNINSIPVSSVVLDGRNLGPTPKLNVSVNAGTHRVTFVHPKHGKRTMSVSVAPGQVKTAAMRLEGALAERAKQAEDVPDPYE